MGDLGLSSEEVDLALTTIRRDLTPAAYRSAFFANH